MEIKWQVGKIERMDTVGRRSHNERDKVPPLQPKPLGTPCYNVDAAWDGRMLYFEEGPVSGTSGTLNAAP